MKRNETNRKIDREIVEIAQLTYFNNVTELIVKSVVLWKKWWLVPSESVNLQIVFSQKTCHFFSTHACSTPSDPLAWCSAARRHMHLLYIHTFQIHVQLYTWNTYIDAFGSTCCMQRGKEMHVSPIYKHIFHIHVQQYIWNTCMEAFGSTVCRIWIQLIFRKRALYLVAL